MEKTNSQQSRGGRSKNKAVMTSRSSKNIDQNDVFGKFEMLSLHDAKALSAKSKGAPLRKKNQAETATPAAVDKSNKQSPKKSHRNSGKKKKGNKKNALGAKPPAVVVEISAANVATSNRKSNKKKNSNGKESVTAAQDQDVENIPPEHCHDGVYPGYYYHEGYYYPDYGYYHDYGYQYYQNYDYYGYPVENDMAYHYHYANMPDHDQSHALNIDAPSFAPTNEDD